MTTAQAPAVPDADVLSHLNPIVAVVFLAVVALGIFLFYFGQPLRDRMTKKESAEKKTATTAPAPGPSSSSTSTPTQAHDRTAELTDRYIADLKAQIERGEEDRAGLEGEIRELRREITLWQDSWRRGAR